jgi:hypothetical protein
MSCLQISKRSPFRKIRLNSNSWIENTCLLANSNRHFVMNCFVVGFAAYTSDYANDASVWQTFLFV